MKKQKQRMEQMCGANDAELMEMSGRTTTLTTTTTTTTTMMMTSSAVQEDVFRQVEMNATKSWNGSNGTTLLTKLTSKNKKQNCQKTWNKNAQKRVVLVTVSL